MHFFDTHNGVLLCTAWFTSPSPSILVKEEVFTTNDGGKNWKAVKSNLFTSALSGHSSGKMVFLDKTHWWMEKSFDAGSGLYSTTDGGQTWTQVRGANSSYEKLYSHQFFSLTKGLARNEFSLIVTLDGGTTWTESFPLPRQ